MSHGVGVVIRRRPKAKGSYVELTPEELEAVAVESTRVIDIKQFVPKKEIDDLYMGNPYYIVPNGEVGQQACKGVPQVMLDQSFFSTECTALAGYILRRPHAEQSAANSGGSLSGFGNTISTPQWLQVTAAFPGALAIGVGLLDSDDDGRCPCGEYY